MNTKLFFLILVLSATISTAGSNAQNSNYHWLKSAGTSNGKSLTDKAGNIYMTLLDRPSYIEEEETPEIGIYIDDLFYPADNRLFMEYVVKYNSSGNLMWRREVITDNYNIWGCISSMCADEDGSLYMVCHLNKNSNAYVKFENNTVHTNPDKDHIVLVKYNANGSLAFVKEYLEYDYAELVTVSTKGYIYLRVGCKNYNDNIALVKMNSDGNVIAVIDDKYIDCAHIGISDSQGNVYLSGYSSENLIIDDKVYEPLSGSYLIKIDSETNRPLWVKTLSLNCLQEQGNIDIFNDNEIAYIGKNETVYDPPFIVKVNLKTNTQTETVIDEANKSDTEKLCYDRHGNIFIMGYTDSDTTYIAKKMVPKRYTFLAKYTPDLKNVWVKIIGNLNFSVIPYALNSNEKGDLLFTIRTSRSEAYAVFSMGLRNFDWLRQSFIWGKCSGIYNVEADFDTMAERPDPNDLIPGAVWVYWDALDFWIMIAKEAWIWFGSDVIYPPQNQVRRVNASGSGLSHSIQGTGSGKVQLYAEPNLSDTTRTDTISITNINNPDIVERFVIRQAPTTTTGINNLQIEKLISVSPNPTSVSFVVTGIDTETLVRVFDPSGKKVLEKLVSPNERISVSDWYKGIYIVKANGKTAKLVVK